MWPNSSESGRSLTKWWSRLWRRQRPQKEPEVPNPVLSTQDLQKRLQDAQEARRQVFLMRKKTEENVRQAHKLLEQNHLADRIRGSFSS